MKAIISIIIYGLISMTTGTAAEPQPTTKMVETADQQRIAYDVHGPSKSLDRSGPTLVFIHGWMCDRSYWRFQTPHFAQNYRVITIDLPGHGQSSDSRQKWSMAAFGRDVASVVAASGSQTVILIGHSMGGPVAIEAARQMPGRVQAVIGVDTLKRPTFKRDKAEFEAMMSHLGANFYAATHSMARDRYFHPASNPALADWVAADMASAPATIALDLVRALEDYDAPGGISAITDIPLGFINSDASAVDNAALTRLHPGVTVVQLPKVRHFLMMEDPAAFNQALQAMITKLSSATPGNIQ